MLMCTTRSWMFYAMLPVCGPQECALCAWRWGIHVRYHVHMATGETGECLAQELNGTPIVSTSVRIIRSI